MSQPSTPRARSMNSRRLFAALGIDVWVRRDRSVDVPELAPAQIDPTREPTAAKARSPSRQETRPSSRPIDAGPPLGEAASIAPDRPESAAPGSSAALPAAFTIYCFQLGDVFAVVEESLWSRRRFFLDVARAFNGFAPAERTTVRFDWPQGGLDAGADRAFQAFYEHQAGQVRHRMICGPLAVTLLGQAVPDDVAWVAGALYLDGETGPAVKQRIWHRLREKP